MNKTEKYSLYSINLFFYLILGLLGGSFHAALPAFTKNLNANVEQISYGLSMQSISNCVGSLLATYFLDKCNKQLIFALSITLMGIFNMMLPLCTNLYIFYAIICSGGLVGSFINPIPSVWTVELFKGNHKFYLQFLHLFYSIGDFLSPLTVGPFLKKNSTASDLFIPYVVMNSFKFLISSLLLITYFIMPYEQNQLNEDEEKIIQKENVDKEKEIKTKSFVVCFTVLISLVFTLVSGTGTNFSTFLTTYLLKLDFGFDQQQAAYAMMIYSGAVLLGRMLTCLGTFRLNEKTMIYLDFFFILSSYILLITLGTKNLTILWTSIFITGLGYSSTLPLIYSFIEKHLKLTSRITSIISLSLSSFLVVNRTFAGHFLNLNPSDFLIMNIILSVIMILIFIFLNIFLKNSSK